MLVAQLRDCDYHQALEDLSKHLFGEIDTETYLKCLEALGKDIFDDEKRAAWVGTYSAGTVIRR